MNIPPRVPPDRSLPDIPPGKKPPLPDRAGKKYLSRSVKPHQDVGVVPKTIKPAGTDKPESTKSSLRKKWDKLKSDATKNLSAAKSEMKQSAKTAGQVIKEGFKDSKIGGKIIEKVDEKTTQWGRKASDRFGGYKASLDKISQETKDKHLTSGSATEAQEEIYQNDLENEAISDAETQFDEAIWREATKYSAVNTKIQEGLQAGLERPKMHEAKALYEKIIRLPNVGAVAESLRNSPNPQAKGMGYLYKAIGLLNGDIACKNPRQQHVMYKKALRDALRSDHYETYKNQPNDFVNLLNAMAAAEFTNVNVGNLTQELAEGRIETRIAEHTDSELQLQPLNMEQSPEALFHDAVNKDRLELVHAGVGNLEDFGAQVRGEWHPSRMDPLIQGNPANIKCQLLAGKKVITCVRTPTPTDGRCKITPEFKAFLRDLKARGEKYTYVNLQSRSPAPLWKKAAGLDGEARRVRNIEALGRDPEFKDVLTVVTLDKNSAFHHQAPSRRGLQAGIQALESYIKELPTDEELQAIDALEEPVAPSYRAENKGVGVVEEEDEFGVDEEMKRLEEVASYLDNITDSISGGKTLATEVAELKNKFLNKPAWLRKTIFDGVRAVQARLPERAPKILKSGFDKLLNVDERYMDKHQWTQLANEIVALAELYGVKLPPELWLEHSAFVDDFMTKLESSKSGFYLPEEWKKDPAIMLEVKNKLQNVYSAVFGDEKTHLTPAERQDFVEIAYMYLTDWAVKKSGADYFHQGCKDNIDRGGGANWLMMSFMTYLKVADESRHGTSPEAQLQLKNMIAALPAKLEEDAIWARKRGMLDERFERAVSALHRLIEQIESDPKALERLIKEYNFTDIAFETINKATREAA